MYIVNMYSVQCTFNFVTHYTCVHCTHVYCIMSHGIDPLYWEWLNYLKQSVWTLLCSHTWYIILFYGDGKYLSEKT